MKMFMFPISSVVSFFRSLTIELVFVCSKVVVQILFFPFEYPINLAPRFEDCFLYYIQ